MKENINIPSYEEIANEILNSAMLNSSEGNWIVYVSELALKYNIKEEWFIEHYDDIADIINSSEEVLDPVQGKEEDNVCFDVMIGLNYLYNIDWRDEENIEFAPSDEIINKIDAYSNSEKYEPLQLIQLQAGLIDALDVSRFDNPELSAAQMKQIRLELYNEQIEQKKNKSIECEDEKVDFRHKRKGR